MLKKLEEVKGISDQKAKKLQEIAKKLTAGGFITVRRARRGPEARASGSHDARACARALSRSRSRSRRAQAMIEYQKQQDLVKLTTGASSLDNLLEGRWRARAFAPPRACAQSGLAS